MNKTFSILIPTFNRAEKLLRLLKIIEIETSILNVKTQIDVIVSDNASKDNTAKIMDEFTTTHFNFFYFRQTQNLGFDANIKFLYEKSRTDFVWYIADDDIPLPGSLLKVIETITEKDPDVLLFSFIQPPGSTFRQFDFLEKTHLVTDPPFAIEQVLKYTKLSIFVIRKIRFTNEQWRILDRNLGSGWYYISLAFSIMESSKNLRLAIISEPLAACDEDYAFISYTPYPLLNMEIMVRHPFVLKYKPTLPKFYGIMGYCEAIQFAFAAKVGSLSHINIQEYDEFIKELNFNYSILLKRPRKLLQFLVLKSNFTFLWKMIRSR